jgi:transglutaminase-like putative cysteine protease
VGYVVDEYDISVRRYLLREKHAYAWPEVYFPTYGWVEFSPYGEAPIISRPVSDAAVGDTTLDEEDLLDGLAIDDFGEIIDSGSGTLPPPVVQSDPWWKNLLPVLAQRVQPVPPAHTARHGRRGPGDAKLSP